MQIFLHLLFYLRFCSYEPRWSGGFSLEAAFATAFDRLQGTW